MARHQGDHAHDSAAIRARLADGASPSYLRDWVYGAIDGAVTTFAIVAGVVGAELSAGVVLALGAANLFADGFSMAAANYSGTRSEHDERRRLHDVEARHIQENPAGERREIREIFRAKGFEGDVLENIVAVVSSDRDLWIETMLAEEYGQPPVLRRPWAAAAATFAAFTVAGSAPLLPFVVLGGADAAAWALGLTAATFFGVGAAKSRWSLTHWARSGGETLAIGLFTAGVAYGVGWLLRDIV